VTGAEGFVGRWLVPAARTAGHEVVASIAPGMAVPAEWRGQGLEVTRADITSAHDRARLAAVAVDAVIHLAAVSSGADARRDPAAAMAVNARATAGLVAAFGAAPRRSRFLFVSTAEVYGGGHEGPIDEDAPVAPISPYGASKAAAEVAVRSEAAASGLEVIIARAFPHTGPGQDHRFVLPAFAARLREAKRRGEHQVAVGNLDVTRDMLDVRDVVRAYLALVERGVAGRVYNVASGRGQHLAECFRALAAIIGVDAEPVQDPALVRPADIPVLVGDPARIIAATGWSPQFPFPQTLQDLVDAQAD
jgi:GDP-4-dehydro-6-deoxy-D-mannose reductase